MDLTKYFKAEMQGQITISGKVLPRFGFNSKKKQDPDILYYHFF